MVWHGRVRSGLEILVRLGMVRFGLEIMVRCGGVLLGTLGHGEVWFGVVRKLWSGRVR